MYKRQRDTHTLIFYEAPHKLLTTLHDIRNVLGNRRLSICRELTLSLIHISLKALETLVEKAGGKIVGQAAVLAEGDAADRKDIFYLEKLPLFFHD